jgi:nicotinate phosphoribosyltransferase
MAKRGKWSGAKDVYRCRGCRTTVVVPAGTAPGPCVCGGTGEALLKPLVRAGRIARDLPPPRTIREYVLDQVTAVSLETPRRQALRQDF